MNKILWFLLIFVATACSGFHNILVKEGDIYLFQGKEKVIISFSDSIEVNDPMLDITAKMISFILSTLPSEFKNEHYLIEGLSEDLFFNFMYIADSMYFINDYYKNKMLLYGYFSSLYEDFMVKNKKYPFIPLADFQKLLKANQLSRKINEQLLHVSVKYAVDDIYFVSILELFERPSRYFYPEKTKEELYRVLIYPEVLSFWNYMKFRFGKKMLLDVARNEYTPEDFQVKFGEDISTLEGEYVRYVQEKKLVDILEEEKTFIAFTNILYLYMSGTKSNLMSG